MSSSKQAKLSHAAAQQDALPSGSQPAASSSSSTLPALPTSHFPSSNDPSISNEEEDETSQTPLHSTSRRSRVASSTAHHHSSSPPSHPSPPSPPPSNSAADNDAQDLDSLDESDEGSDSYGSEDDYAWIPWFCALKGNEFFSEVDEEFAQDAFNLTGLEQLVPYFDQALDMILDVELTDVMTEETQEIIENDAENLFGLIHARYIITSRGLQAMLDKYRLFHFGRCPRVLCRGQAVLPIGLSDTPNEDSVKLYCPRCEELYATKAPRHEHIDGAYFGTTFAHLFFLTFPELKVSKSKEFYVPRVFGFRIHKSAYKKSLEMRKKEKDKEKERRKKDATMQQQQQQGGAAAAGQPAAGGAGQAPMLTSGTGGTGGGSQALT